MQAIVKSGEHEPAVRIRLEPAGFGRSGASAAAGALATRTPATHFPSMPSAAAVLQVQLVRAMTAEDKLRLSQALRDSAWEFKAAWIRSNQPELPEAAVQEAVRRLFRHAGA